MEQISLNWEEERHVFTVTEITGAIQGALESFGDVWVAGEISGTKQAASGHFYFTMKDDKAQISCVCWRTLARTLRFRPADGVAVLARGRIDVYPPRGSYQLVVEALEPQGLGALQLAFEQLKKKLAAEGLFEESRKRPLPPYPARIGIVTSPTGAAIRDMVHVLTRRFPGIHVRLFPALVQGEGSVRDVVRGIESFGASGWPDLLIVGRGGGSLEDLWTYNEEPVARAIAASPVPVISAVGHETDFTIADFVADLRAPTPSAAAEVAVPEKRELLEQLQTIRSRLGQCMRYQISEARSRLHERGVDRAAGLLRREIGRSLQQVDELDYRLRDRVRIHLAKGRQVWQDLDGRLSRKDLRLELAAVGRRLEQFESALSKQIAMRLTRSRASLEPLTAALGQLSPLAVLDRGYAIIRDKAGKVIRTSVEAPPGTALDVRLAKGRLEATVDRRIDE